MRYNNSTGLFGSTGDYSTEGTCSYCGRSWEPDDCGCENIEECECQLDYNDNEEFDTIGKLTICSNCYESFERAIIFRMKEILPWFTKILASKLDEIKQYNNLLQGIPVDVEIELERFTKLELK